MDRFKRRSEIIKIGNITRKDNELHPIQYLVWLIITIGISLENIIRL